jgi:hypothetical protein
MRHAFKVCDVITFTWWNIHSLYASINNIIYANVGLSHLHRRIYESTVLVSIEFTDFSQSDNFSFATMS